MLVVELLFERQQTQDEIDGRTDRSHASLPPRPHLRAHVLDDRNASLFQLRRQAQIEFLGIDADVHVGPLRCQPLEQLTPDAQQSRQMREDLDQAHDRQALDALPRFAARLDHPRAGDAGKARLRKARTQCVNQPRAKVVARDLTGDKDKERPRNTGRWGLTGRRHRLRLFLARRRGLIPDNAAHLTIPTRSRRGVVSLRKATKASISGCSAASFASSSVASASLSLER